MFFAPAKESVIMPVITLPQLNTFCQQSILPLPHYYENSRAALEVMYLSGCRPAEAVDLSLWSVVNPTLFNLRPLKRNKTRSIDVSNFPPLFLSYFSGGSQEYRLATQSRCLNYFRHTWPAKQLQKGSKNVELYCYRYRYVKQLHANGATIQQIQNNMGWNNTELAQRYVDSVLYTD